MSTNDDGLQYEKIKRMIQSSPYMVRQHSNSKLSYSRIKRIIETSPLERKSTEVSVHSRDELSSSKSIDTLMSFCGGKTLAAHSQPRERFEMSQEVGNVSPRNEQTDLRRDGRTGKAQIFVGGTPKKSKLGIKGNISQVARGKSWITVKID